MELLRQQLVTAQDGIQLITFFESCASRHAMIVALLAVLELVRLQAIVLTQKQQFGEIRLRKHKMFDLVFAGGEALNETLDDPLRRIDG
jgi:chromatin segregation and condensation protein Rec8/ScpA/Scc1 (kleisin family)